MGLRIFNGYKIEKKDLSAVELFNLLKEFQAKAQKSFEEVFYKKVSDFIADYFDYREILGEEEAKKRIKLKYKYIIDIDTLDLSFIDCIINELIHTDSSSKSPLHTKFDFTYKVSLYPFKDYTLMLVKSIQNDFDNIFGYMDDEGNEVKSKYWDFVSPFYYYSVYEISDKISEAELEERKNIWNKALNNTALEFNLGEIPTFLDEKKISILLIENYENRIETLCNKILQDDYLKKDATLDKVEDFYTYKKSEEFKLKLSELKNEIKEKLPKTYY